MRIVFFHPLWLAEAACAKAMNVAVTFLYRNGLWLRDVQARRLSAWLFGFLAHYAMLVSLTLAAVKARYPVYPKSHMVCHTALELLREAAESEWVLSPLATACQQAEDFIGKPSKVSRSTNIRQAHRSVIWRSLIKIQFCLQEAALDERGMDSQPRFVTDFLGYLKPWTKYGLIKQLSGEISRNHWILGLVCAPLWWKDGNVV